MAQHAWTARHFSLANSEPSQAGNLPRLLRRVAGEIERREIAPESVLDLVAQQQAGPSGPTWAVTVYWSDQP
jgi:hypothetical protein